MAQQKKEKEEIINEPQVTLIDRDSLIKRRYRQGVITTTMGRSFAIKSIDPKTMLLTRGSAFLPAFTDFMDDPEPEKITDPEINDFIKDVVCRSITSLKFANKPLEECSDEETPLDVLDLDEIVEIFSAVMEMVSSEDEKDEWSFLPATTEES